MTYDFDEIVPRKGTNSIKYDFAKERGLPEDVLPLWVADMDFRAPREVTEAMVKVAEHGIFGYSDVKEDYFIPIRDWFLRRFDFELKKEWLKKTPGVVYALNTAIRAYAREGEAVLIQSPVYYPFFSGVRENGRKLIDSELIYKDGQYGIDFLDFERKIRENNVKLFLLCSPHNPVGRVWREEELRRMGEICLRHKVLIFSDEIHCDFVWRNNKHLIFNSLDPKLSEISILATAPSKTFNLAGLMISHVFIPNRELKALFSKQIDKTGLSQLSVMGLAAAKAAYSYGENWLNELKSYLLGNLSFAEDFIQKILPGVSLCPVEGTYLLWLDFHKTGKTNEEIQKLIIHKAKLWLDEGLIFGEAGRLFQRINMAAPRSILQDALERLERALKD
jgi:cystathionine beta-lyase